MINPADDSVVANVPIDGPAEVAATVARVRANQPACEELGIMGRAEWLYKLRDWLLDQPATGSPTPMQRRPARSAPKRWARLPYVLDLINFYGQERRKYIGDEKVPAHSPLMKAEEAAGPVPARTRWSA